MKEFDVAIIGGGLAGCSAAYYLSKFGARVVVLEKGDINQGASGRNAGSLHFQLEYRLIRHYDRLKEQLSHLIPFTRIAMADWRGLEAELGESVELSLGGGFMVAESADEAALLETKAAFENRHGLEVSFMSGDVARRQAPYLSSTIRAALFCADEGHCNPRLVTPAFLRAARRLGAKVRPRTEVRMIEKHGDRWRIGAHSLDAPSPYREEVICGAVLNVAGAWAGEITALAGAHLPVYPVGLTMNVTEEAPPFMHGMVQHVGRRLSMKQVEAGNVLIGGGCPARLAYENGWRIEQPTIIPDVVVENLRTAADIAPAIRDLKLLRSWAGVTGVTPDQLPIIGEIRQLPGFYVATGGAGFTFGPTYSRLVSEIIVKGEASYPLTPFSPDRFDHINMFMGR